jgi:hypothetical protein
MSNYTVTTNFGAKDLLSSGNPAKLILGAQLTTEFNNIATAIGTKYDTLSIAVVGGTSAVARTTDNVMTSNTTLTADSQLQLAIPGAGTYSFKFMLKITGAAGGFDLATAAGANVTNIIANAIGYMGSSTPPVSGIAAVAFAGVETFGIQVATLDNANPSNFLTIDGVMTTTAASSLTILISQNTSNAASTSVKTGSYLQMTRLS